MGNRFKEIAIIALITIFLLFSIESICRYRIPKDPIDDQVARLAREPVNKGTIRIFFYGESTMFGVPVPEIGIVEQVRYILNKTYPNQKFELVNFAQPGISSFKLSSIVNKSIHLNPNLAIVMLGHNEFLSPTIDSPSFRSFLDNLATYKWLQKKMLKMEWKWNRKARILPKTLKFIADNAELIAKKKAAFTENLDSILSLIRSYSIPTLLSTSPSNLLDWAPAHQRLPTSFRNESFQAEVHALVQRVENAKRSEVKEAIEQLAKTYPDEATLFYLRGKLDYASGNFRDAKENLKRAKDLDPVPYRCLSQFEEVIRSHASDPNVKLVDSAMAIEKSAQNGLPGFDLISDNCHPNPRGNFVIAQELFRKIKESGIIPVSPAMVEVNGVEEFLNSISGPRSRLDLEFLAAMENGKYVMKAPAFNFGVAKNYFLKAQALKPNDWTATANLATAELLLENKSIGIELLALAAKQKGSPLELQDAVHPFLQESIDLIESAQLASGIIK